MSEQRRIPRVLEALCYLILLLTAVIPTAATADEPASGLPEPQGVQLRTEPQLPPRLAPLGLEKLMDLPISSVTRRESTVGESAAAVSVISQEDIRRSGATTIAELFRRVPGMNVARVDNNKWAISARGFNDRFSNKLLVQRDERTIYDPLFAGVYWNAVDYPLEDIERIEVIRGPGSSLWGANAINGIINIVTKPANSTQGGLLSAGGGSPEGGFGQLRYGSTVGDKVDYRLYAKGFARDKQFSQQGDTHDDWNNAGAGMRLDWRQNDLNTMTVQGDYLHSDAGRQDPVVQTTPPFIAVMADRTVADSGNILGRWTHRKDEQRSWTLQAYWARFNTKQPSADIANDNDCYDLDFQQQFPLGERHQFMYGLGYRFIDQTVGKSLSNNGLSASWLKNSFPLSIYSGFVQDEYLMVPDSLRLLLGFKLEHNDFTGFEIEPTARLLWTPTKRQTLWAAVSRAVGTPSIAEEGILLSALPPTRLPSGAQLFPRVTGNPQLGSVELIAYELGYRAQVSEGFSLDSAFFYNRYHGLVVSVPLSIQGGFAPGTAILPVLFENRMTGETYGAEFAADWRPFKWWRLYGTYTFLEMHLHADSNLPASTRTDAESAVERSPQQQVFLQSSFDLPRNLEFDLMGRFVDRLVGFMQEIPSYFSLDARLAWRPRKGLEISVVGQNLLDDHHPEFGVSSFIAAPLVEIRRNVYAKTTWWF
jgi:iron complex outermembrane receptor protein